VGWPSTRHSAWRARESRIGYPSAPRAAGGTPQQAYATASRTTSSRTGIGSPIRISNSCGRTARGSRSRSPKLWAIESRPRPMRMGSSWATSPGPTGRFRASRGCCSRTSSASNSSRAGREPREPEGSGDPKRGAPPSRRGAIVKDSRSRLGSAASSATTQAQISSSSPFPRKRCRPGMVAPLRCFQPFSGSLLGSPRASVPTRHPAQRQGTPPRCDRARRCRAPWLRCMRRAASRGVVSSNRSNFCTSCYGCYFGVSSMISYGNIATLHSLPKLLREIDRHQLPCCHGEVVVAADPRIDEAMPATSMESESVDSRGLMRLDCRGHRPHQCGNRCVRGLCNLEYAASSKCQDSVGLERIRVNASRTIACRTSW